MTHPVFDFSSAHPDVLILIGTVTGNTERVAEDVAAVLSDYGFTVHLLDMVDALPETLVDFSQVIICTSSWGDGEVPDNAIDLFDALNTYRPDLSHVQYGVIGLGDRIYEPHFCGGAVRFDELFRSLGADCVAERHEIDAGPTVSDCRHACTWALRCASAFSAEFVRTFSAA